MVFIGGGNPEEHQPGEAAYRYVGNMRKREVHDRNKAGGRCHLDKIKFPINFASLDTARLENYDLCGHCIRSER